MEQSAWEMQVSFFIVSLGTVGVTVYHGEFRFLCDNDAMLRDPIKRRVCA